MARGVSQVFVGTQFHISIVANIFFDLGALLHRRQYYILSHSVSVRSVCIVLLANAY